MTIKPRSITALTMARNTTSEYQVTYWNDGVARFDGKSGQRQGAWDAKVEESWFARACKLARNLSRDSLHSAGSATTIVLDTVDGRLVYEADQTDEPAEFWTLSTLIDGMCHRTRWSPIDTTGEDDFSPFGFGVPVWMNVAGATATGVGRNGEILVLAGSIASTSTQPSINSSYAELRTALLRSGDLVLESDHLRLTRHLRFESPSAAASVLCGSNTSGPRAWQDSAGRAWSELDLQG